MTKTVRQTKYVTVEQNNHQEKILYKDLIAHEEQITLDDLERLKLRDLDDDIKKRYEKIIKGNFEYLQHKISKMPNLVLRLDNKTNHYKVLTNK